MLENLIIHNEKIVCPRCDGNGLLYQTTLKPINHTIIMCDECDAIWPTNIQSITKSNFEDFTTYVQSRGYAYNDIDLININYNWFINKV